MISWNNPEVELKYVFGTKVYDTDLSKVYLFIFFYFVSWNVKLFYMLVTVVAVQFYLSTIT